MGGKVVFVAMHPLCALLQSFCTVQFVAPTVIVASIALQMSPISPQPAAFAYQPSGAANVVAMPTSVSLAASPSSCEATDVSLFSSPPFSSGRPPTICPW
jgi:hypothetical protein